MAKRKDNLYSWEHQRRVQYDQKLKDEQFFKDKARYEEKKAKERRLSEMPTSPPTTAQRIIGFCIGSAIIIFFIVFLKSPDFQKWVLNAWTFVWTKILSVIKWFLPDI